MAMHGRWCSVLICSGWYHTMSLAQVGMHMTPANHFSKSMHLSNPCIKVGKQIQIATTVQHDRNSDARGEEQKEPMDDMMSHNRHCANVCLRSKMLTENMKQELLRLCSSLQDLSAHGTVPSSNTVNFKLLAANFA